jgi:glycosyltransferase involved in cell wall biosynthesis
VQPAKIGIDVTSAVVQGGGIGRYTRELVRAVVAADRVNEFTLFSSRWPDRLPVPDPLPSGPNVRKRAAPVSDRWLYRLWYRLRLPVPVQWLTGPLDLFHSPDFVLPPVRRGVPTLLTVHDLSFIHYPEAFTSALLRYLHTAVPRSIAQATHILADSRATRDDLAAIWQVPLEKITVLYSGVSRSFAPLDDVGVLRAMRQRYGLGDEPYVLSVSTIQPRKNYRMLIQSFRDVSRQLPHHLVIAGGRGWLFEAVMAEVDRQGLADRVHFAGFVADTDLPALYSAADLFVFPSLYEGFGLPILEAMACGTPVLSSDASCLPEVAGDAAVLVSPHDVHAWSEAQLKLLTSPGLRAGLVEAGLARAHQFSWEKSAQKLLGVYRRMLS